MRHDFLSTLFLHWWDSSSSGDLTELATEALISASYRAKRVKKRLELDNLTEWITWANQERGIAPTLQDLVTQYGVIKGLGLGQ